MWWTRASRDGASALFKWICRWRAALEEEKTRRTVGIAAGFFREVIAHPATDVVHEMRHISHVSGRQRDRWNTLPCSTATLLETGPCGADSNRCRCYSIFNSSDKARGATWSAGFVRKWPARRVYQGHVTLGGGGRFRVQWKIKSTGVSYGAIRLAFALILDVPIR